ncbi:MAG: hypothetical protein KTR31_05080 [Myxococcales bacterium]|nr:hypothetical protein [Myxococcales bacterium]
MTSLLALSLCTAHADEPSARPGGGPERAILAVAGTAAAAAGAVWFFDGGIPGAGDPGVALMGAGLLGVAGAALGSGARGLSIHEEEVGPRVSAPWVAASLGSWGTPTFGETAPAVPILSTQPRIWFTDRLRFTPATAVRVQLGPRVSAEATGEGDVQPVLSQTQWGVDAAWELRGYPGDPSERLLGAGRVELVGQVQANLRFERLDFVAAGGGRRLRRGQIVPLAVGARWNLSERQRYEVIAGPRLDWLSWAEPDGAFTGAWLPAPLLVVARYDVQVPHPGLLAGLDGRSRLRLTYETSRFDGAGIDVGAVIGYLGPVHLTWETHLHRPGARVGAWLGLQATVAQDSAVMLTLGVAPGEEP